MTTFLSMLNHFAQSIFNHFAPIIYVQLSPDRLMVRNPKSGVTVSERPEIAISRMPKPKMVAVGAAARTLQASPGVEVVNPFAHPRSLVSDFVLGEQTLKAFLARMNSGRFFAPAPKIVMHLMGDPAGGFTQIEVRAFREMALGSGASQVSVWQGRPLTDHELLSGRFPDSGQVLC